MNRGIWFSYFVRWTYIRVVHKLTGKYRISKDTYGTHVLYGQEEGNKLIRESLANDKPFAFGRYSYVEMDYVQKYITETKFGICMYPFVKGDGEEFKLTAADKYNGTRKFGELMLKSISNLDMVGIWNNIYMGDAVLEEADPKRKILVTDATALEPYGKPHPWTESLKGKKVLVVSPFDEEIKQQYAIREKLWEDKNMLPEFELLTVKSVWYFAGAKDERFSNWFEALDYLYQEVIRHDFDVALLSCGPFGLPLAAMIKAYGKQAVHMGGTLQILFGIKGKRWDDNASINRFYNEHWIRPGEITKPDKSKVLDSDCYW
jgi:hypothetical protein